MSNDSSDTSPSEDVKVLETSIDNNTSTSTDEDESTQLTEKGNPFNSPPECPFLSADWDKQQPSKLCLQRIKRDVNDIIKDPIVGAYAVSMDDNFTRVNAMIVGNLETPYEGGFFHFHIRVGPTYPSEPPRVCSVSCYRFGHQVRFNPNLYTNGKVCLSAINTWSGPGWLPSFDIRYLLTIIQSTVFVDNALCNEPGYEQHKKKDSKMVEMYDIYVRHETIRVAVIETLKNSRKCGIDERHIETMEQLFLSFFHDYIESCEDLCKYDGATLDVAPQIYRIELVPRFSELKKELIVIRKELEEKGHLRELQGPGGKVTTNCNLNNFVTTLPQSF